MLIFISGPNRVHKSEETSRLRNFSQESPRTQFRKSEGLSRKKYRPAPIGCHASH